MKRFIQILWLLLYCLLFSYFCYLSTRTGSESSGLSLIVTEYVKKLIDSIFNTNINIDSIHTIVRKLIGHFSYFVIFGFVSYMFYLTLKNKKAFILHYSIGFILALVSEFICEANTIGRSASFTDVLIDYSGFIVISLFIYLCIFLSKRHLKNKYSKTN